MEYELGIYLIIIIIILFAVILISVARNILVTNGVLPDQSDVVIIGGGVAGCILAARLHDKYPNKIITVVERGSDYRNDPNVFRLQNALIAAYTQPYSEVITPDFPGLQCSLANMYGGGSSHNFGLVVTGSEYFYRSKWCPILDTTYDHVKCLFTKINKTIDIVQALTSLNIVTRIGPIIQILLSNGWVPISQGWNIFTNPGPLRANDQITTQILTAMQIPVVDNYNSGISICASANQQLFLDNVLGVRDSVNRAYLPTGNIYPPGLNIISNAEVDTIHSDLHITFKDGRVIKANDKIILSAGGIYSPYILKKSGFIVDQLGENLITHYGCSMILIAKDIPDFSSGPIAFVPFENDTRFYQVVVGGSMLTNFELLKKQGIDTVSLQKQGYIFISFLLWIMDPQARGSVDIGDTPIIKLRLFENESDRTAIVNGLRWLGQVYFRLKNIQCIFPPEDVFLRNDNDELLKYAMTGVSLTDHYCSTCQYGTVLDDNFMLKGYNNIHVVDASAFPHISDGNTQYPTMVLAELAAERIVL